MEANHRKGIEILKNQLINMKNDVGRDIEEFRWHIDRAAFYKEKLLVHRNNIKQLAESIIKLKGE